MAQFNLKSLQTTAWIQQTINCWGKSGLLRFGVEA